MESDQRICFVLYQLASKSSEALEVLTHDPKRTQELLARHNILFQTTLPPDINRYLRECNCALCADTLHSLEQAVVHANYE